MILLPSKHCTSNFGDEVVLNSIDWLEKFPWRQENGTKNDKDRFEIVLNVKDFEPNELSVKTIDGFIVIEGRHGEKKDEQGIISRHFVRKYLMPNDCIPEKMESRLSSKGLLSVIAPRKQVARRETVIPISHEGVKSKL